MKIVRAEWGRVSLTVERLIDIAVSLDVSPAELLERSPQEVDFKPIKWLGGRQKISEFLEDL